MLHEFRKNKSIMLHEFGRKTKVSGYMVLETVEYIGCVDWLLLALNFVRLYGVRDKI